MDVSTTSYICLCRIQVLLVPTLSWSFTCANSERRQSIGPNPSIHQGSFRWKKHMQQQGIKNHTIKMHLVDYHLLFCILTYVTTWHICVYIYTNQKYKYSNGISSIIMIYYIVSKGNTLETTTQTPYCWWKKSCTTWDILNPVNNGINYTTTNLNWWVRRISEPSTVSLPFCPKHKLSMICAEIGNHGLEVTTSIDKSASSIRSGDRRWL